VGLHEIKRLLHNKRNGHQIEQTTHRMGENLPAIYLTKTSIYRELKKLYSPKLNDPMKKWTNEPNRAFAKEEVQMGKNHRKKFSPSLAIKEMQIKTTLRF
jgi:hypothetical protein